MKGVEGSVVDMSGNHAKIVLALFGEHGKTLP